jgi:hypothetical protein
MQKLYHTLLFESAVAVSRDLTAAGIKHFFVKGVALLNRVYQPGDRSMSDMDLYIQPQSRTRALDVLRRLGFRECPAADQAGPEELRTALALRRDSSSEIEEHVVDLHWSLDPVERLLPRRDRDVPEDIWENIADDRPVPAPKPEYHAAILAHHLVHTDLLHVRNVLDIAYEFASMPDDGGDEYLSICRELRIGRFAAALAKTMAVEFSIERPRAMGVGSVHTGQLERELSPERWLKLTARSHPHDDEAITVARIRRRLRFVDTGAAKTLFQDLFFPPEAFLRWRWLGRGLVQARMKHYLQLVKKAWQW